MKNNNLCEPSAPLREVKKLKQTVLAGPVGDSRFLRLPFGNQQGNRHIDAERSADKPFSRYARERRLQRELQGVVLRRCTVRYAEVPVGSVEGCQRIHGELLDKPLHIARHSAASEGQDADLRGDLGHVPFLVAGLPSLRPD